MKTLRSNALAIFAATLCSVTPTTQGIILFRTGDPAANATAPTGDLAESGWQFEGSFGAFLGTAIAPHFFLTARHIGAASNSFNYHGANYTIIGWTDDPESDLRIYQVAEALPTYAPLYSRNDEVGQRLVVIGRGTQRGAGIITNNTLHGWSWGIGDMVQRWGENRVASIYGVGASDLLYSRFDQDDLLHEADLSSGDSGGAVFLNDGGVWKLAGINFTVDGPLLLGPNEQSKVYGAFFDERGLYNDFLITGNLPVPSGFYASRISSKLAWIQGVISPGLANLSARVSVGTGDAVAIDGFVIRGATTTTKRVMVRGLGPSLEVNGTAIPGRLIDPMLELHDSTGALILANDNWNSTQGAEIEESGLAPGSNREAAIVAHLAPGSYTAILRGVGNTAGVGLVEVFDLDGASDPQLANLSARGYVGQGDDVLIGGLILRGVSSRLIIRALGPELSRGVAGYLEDPLLELRDANGELVASNDNWNDGGNSSEIAAMGFAPRNNRESAILTTPRQGSYTAIVRGSGAARGIALLEAYLIE